MGIEESSDAFRHWSFVGFVAVAAVGEQGIVTVGVVVGATFAAGQAACLGLKGAVVAGLVAAADQVGLAMGPPYQRCPRDEPVSREFQEARRDWLPGLLRHSVAVESIGLQQQIFAYSKN